MLIYFEYITNALTRLDALELLAPRTGLEGPREREPERLPRLLILFCLVTPDDVARGIEASA